MESEPFATLSVAPKYGTSKTLVDGFVGPTLGHAGESLVMTDYAPSLRVAKFACGWYGFGHTNLRDPGDTRGTAVGKKGRFRCSEQKKEVIRKNTDV
ncbi:hypothetical protein BH24ACT22_BH24ACT22_10900 [soil metagenome]